MGWLKHLRPKSPQPSSSPSYLYGCADPDAPPPEWAPASEPSSTYGMKNEAPEDEYEAAEEFCEQNPPDSPRFLPSADVDRIREIGCKGWTLVPPKLSRFKGHITEIRTVRGKESSSSYTSGEKSGPKVIEIVTEKGCGDSCVLSNYPIMAGLYDIQGKEGVYYEVTILQMDGVIAIGSACLPYPEYRFPGWNRLSTGLHLDDMQKFFEDPNGGRPYSSFLSSLPSLSSNDTIGFGYIFSTGTIFYTYNGERLEDAFLGVYLPRTQYDVYAAIGVGGPGVNRLRVNFGGDDEEYLFKWKPGREWAWRIEGHVGRMAGGGNEDEELPSYPG
ncbi:hypothetical protein A7U60_g3778 [Sanghuangporus baumii]|uniref:B30.2/SPRY domain-containing protein n=1 Tax=Sanghuangporus baumii TaxID=108892 RepID=A0A9Q5HZY1_SANBA|nr:hypothetical protein A7U60_g3778 [Sanghuangporus baumii]